MDLNLLQLFVAVARTASFSAAARELGLPKSTVSRGVARLEAELGAQLLHRTTRKVALSTAGAALYERVVPSLGSLQEALGSLPEREEEPSGELRLTAPNDLGATFLAELCAAFTARYPRVRLDVRLTNRAVDLVGEGFDLALRVSTRRLADSSLVVRQLGALESQLFASPAYLARRGTPRASEELARHDLVAFRSQRPAELPVQHESRIVGDDFLFVREAVRAGAGLALMPTFLCQEDVAAGRLVPVLPRVTRPGGTLLMLYPRTKHVPRKTVAFRDFLLDTLRVRPLGPRAG